MKMKMKKQKLSSLALAWKRAKERAWLDFKKAAPTLGRRLMERGWLDIKKAVEISRYRKEIFIPKITIRPLAWWLKNNLPKPWKERAQAIIEDERLPGRLKKTGITIEEILEWLLSGSSLRVR